MKLGKVVMGLLAALVLSPTAQACSVCFGKNDSAMTQGLNMGIFVLLLVITAVLALICTFFVFIARRSAQLEQQQQNGGVDPDLLTKH